MAAKTDREIIGYLAQAIAEIAAGHYKQATDSAREALDLLKANCFSCGRPFREE